MNATRFQMLAGILAIVALLTLGGCSMKTQQSQNETPKPTATAGSSDRPADTSASAAPESTVETIKFQAADGLTVTADLYRCGVEDAPFILLFHQAGYSRGEYLEIAPQLSAMGYDCLAVDQRSGNKSNGVENETHKAAVEKKHSSGYADAYPDLEGALIYAVEQYAPKKLIAWGSSYSASLTLILAAEHPQEVQAALAFSPGEYFKFHDQSIAAYAANITQPVFITSGKSEVSAWRMISDAIPSKGCEFFVPQGNGVHGSSALFESTPNHAEYWDAVKKYLASLE